MEVSYIYHMELRDLGYVPLHECDSMSSNLWALPWWNDINDDDLQYTYQFGPGVQGPDEYVKVSHARFADRIVCSHTHMDGDYKESHTEEECLGVLAKVMLIEDEDLPRALCSVVILKRGLLELRNKAIQYRLAHGI